MGRFLRVDFSSAPAATPDILEAAQTPLNPPPMLNPSVANSLDARDERQQVTAIISHHVRPGREPGYEEWIHGISSAAQQFVGHLGVTIVRPPEHNCSEHVVILRFDRYENLKGWLESEVRQQWIEHLNPLIKKPESIQTLTGLETWFTLPGQPLAKPPRYKMALVTWLAVFATTSVLSRLLAPMLSGLPLLLRQLISTGLVVVCLTYVVMPRLTRLLQRWLRGKQT